MPLALATVGEEKTIDILLENEESFKKHFEDIGDKKAFMDYPIYTLYSKNES